MNYYSLIINLFHAITVLHAYSTNYHAITHYL